MRAFDFLRSTRYETAVFVVLGGAYAGFGVCVLVYFDNISVVFIFIALTGSKIAYDQNHRIISFNLPDYSLWRKMRYIKYVSINTATKSHSNQLSL